MAKSLQEILGYQNLCGVITDPKGGVPDDIIPAGFFRRTRTIQGQSGHYFKVAGTRTVARQVDMAQPSPQRNKKGVTRVPFKCACLKEHLVHDPDTMTQLQSFDSPAIQKLGQQEVARQTASFRKLFGNARVSYVYSVLTKGAIYVDGDGELLYTSGGAVGTMDYSVPANNLNQLNGILAASWATVGTDIVAQIKALKVAARKLSGYPLKYAFYGSAVLGYFMKNTDMKNIIAGNPAYKMAFLNLEIPDGFLGLTWIPCEQAFFEDSGGTNRDWWASNQVVFTPEPESSWWEVVEGTTSVPKSIGNVRSDAMGAIGDVALATGMYSYAYIMPEPDPVAIKQIAGDVWMPQLKVPAAIFIGTVQF